MTGSLGATLNAITHRFYPTFNTVNSRFGPSLER
jgi:hypothetical protein